MKYKRHELELDAFKVISCHTTPNEKLIQYLGSLNIEFDYYHINDFSPSMYNGFYLVDSSEQNQDLEDRLKGQKYLYYSFDSSCSERVSSNTLYFPMKKNQLVATLDLFNHLDLERKLSLDLEEYIQSNSTFINLGELTASVIHDLNNFMMVSSASYSGIKFVLEHKFCEEKIKKFCRLGSRATDELMRISAKCDSFLSGGSTLKIETFSLFDLCSWLGEMFQSDLRLHNIDLKLSVNKGVVLECDQSVLLQALLNLLKNSIRAIKNSHGEKWIEINFKMSLEDFRIEFVDSGRGDADKLDNAFRVSSSRELSQGGHGIGLYLVRKRLSELNIAISSVKSSHTTFVMVLPRDMVTYGIST